MKKKTILKLSFTKNNISVMTDLLSYITVYSSSLLLTKTGFVIKYNPFGGYYGLFIECESKKHANAFKTIIKAYKEERGI